MSKKSEESIGTEEHRCSQCNRSNEHLLFAHSDGVEMQCRNCDYRFLDIRTESKLESEIESITDGN